MNEELDSQITHLQTAFKQLKMSYEKYFIGIERLAPHTERENLKKNLRKLLYDATNNNTGRKFKLQSIQNSLLTMEPHWDRICQQIEEGTYKRDKDKVARANQAASAQTSPPPAAKAVSSPAVTYSDAIVNLHKAYEKARVELGGVTKPVPIATLANAVEKQVEQLKAQFKCKDVEFRVLVRDGKPIVKAIPK